MSPVSLTICAHRKCWRGGEVGRNPEARDGRSWCGVRCLVTLVAVCDTSPTSVTNRPLRVRQYICTRRKAEDRNGRSFRPVLELYTRQMHCEQHTRK